RNRKSARDRSPRFGPGNPGHSPHSGTRNSEESVTRRVKMLAGLVAIAVVGTGCLAIPGVGWRFAVIEMKLKGDVPAFGWRELLWNLRPQSSIYLGNLPVVRNLDLAITNPYTSA